MRKHIVAGNWKMNKNLQEGVALATELKEILAAEKPNCDVIIGTPFIHLATVSELLKDSVIAVSAENCANKASGAYTGEVSAEMVKSTGAEYVILGHSERREYYNETPEILKEKVDLALANGLKVIFASENHLSNAKQMSRKPYARPSSQAAYSTSLQNSGKTSSSHMSQSGPSAQARLLRQNRPRKSTPTSAPV